MRLFIAAARAYLEGCLTERELAALFLRGDGPPGFEVIMRDRLRTWARRNATLFDDDESALVVVVTGALAAAVSEVVQSGDRELAEDVLDHHRADPARRFGDRPLQRVISPTVRRFTEGFYGYAVALFVCLGAVGLFLLVTPQSSGEHIPKLDYSITVANFSRTASVPGVGSQQGPGGLDPQQQQDRHRGGRRPGPPPRLRHRQAGARR